MARTAGRPSSSTVAKATYGAALMTSRAAESSCERT
jgi:hypothetical protein